MYQFFKLIAVLIFLVLACFVGFGQTPVVAQTPAFTKTNDTSTLLATPWHEFEGGRVRLALQPIAEKGRLRGVIEVNLKPDWKTYWKNPGNSGMAPSFDFSPPSSYEIMYPVPHLFKDGSDWSIGYKNSVLLPFTVEKADNGESLKGQLTIGLCKEICMPLDIPFDFSDQNANTALSSSLLTMAEEKLPETTPENIVIRASNNENILNVTITHQNGQNISALFLDGKTDEIGPAEIIKNSRNETVFAAPIIAKNSKGPLTISYIVEAKPASFTGMLTSQSK
ncbi:protein-disulfide reductase DsbD domain-containing protein [uncultured Bartonella sp.]|uniref:protein-disulfide reductase DsbD domain-containing protein n=1 Tax=uncultured Bartonella sp. TaxID=104108 RepID=UPI0025CE4B81|nr:protein-disulfide reductase DsbD domain-containing protein [uncultured Bartonella sp.]